MRSINHSNWVFVWALLFATAAIGLPPSTRAAPREASKNDAALLKLQGMIKSLTAERDAAKAETAGIVAELEQLKKDKQAALAAKDSLGSELTAQKNSVADVRSRLDKSEGKLQDVTEKLAQTNSVRTGLENELTALKAKHQVSEQQLKICGDHNVKLYESGRELLERYQSKGTLEGLIQEEPLLQFQSVEMQNIVQEYEDTINSHQFIQIEQQFN
jgi:chromosome segregation ATPase